MTLLQSMNLEYYRRGVDMSDLGVVAGMNSFQRATSPNYTTKTPHQGVYIHLNRTAIDGEDVLDYSKCAVMDGCSQFHFEKHVLCEKDLIIFNGSQSFVVCRYQTPPSGLPVILTKKNFRVRFETAEHARLVSYWLVEPIVNDTIKAEMRNRANKNRGGTLVSYSMEIDFLQTIPVPTIEYLREKYAVHDVKMRIADACASLSSTTRALNNEDILIAVESQLESLNIHSSNALYVEEQEQIK